MNDNTKTWEAVWRLFKFKDPGNVIAKLLQSGVITVQEAITKFPDAFIGTVEWKPNTALLSGLYLLTGIIGGIDTSTAKWDNANAKLGIGDSATAAVATQTDLMAATNKFYKAMDTGFPKRAASAVAATQFLLFQSTYGTTEANYAWNEYVVRNGLTSGVCLNRFVSAKGTKVSGETWTLQLQMNFS